LLRSVEDKDTQTAQTDVGWISIIEDALFARS